MGRISATPTYRVEVILAGGMAFTPAIWNVRSRTNIPGNGKPTKSNLDKYVRGVEQSTIDGPNKHLGRLQIVSARIINQFTDEVMAIWLRSEEMPDQPKFEVIN